MRTTLYVLLLGLMVGCSERSLERKTSDRTAPDEATLRLEDVEQLRFRSDGWIGAANRVPLGSREDEAVARSGVTNAFALSCAYTGSNVVTCWIRNVSDRPARYLDLDVGYNELVSVERYDAGTGQWLSHTSSALRIIRTMGGVTTPQGHEHVVEPGGLAFPYYWWPARAGRPAYSFTVKLEDYALPADEGLSRPEPLRIRQRRPAYRFMLSPLPDWMGDLVSEPVECKPDRLLVTESSGPR